MKARRSEWILLVWFLGAALVGQRPRHWVCLLLVAAAVWLLSWRRWELARDWLPYPLMLLAYRSVGWMATPHESRAFEQAMVAWDRRLLEDLLLRSAIEGLGWVIPAILELSYLLVYGMPAYMVAVFWAAKRRRRLDLAWVAVLLATLGAYAFYPFVPSDPPRAVFPGQDLPLMTVIRRWNLMIAGNYGIHTSVFPSGHAAAAFGSAFATLLFLPENRRPGRWLLGLAMLIAVATVYGRYHYAADTAAGVALAALAAAVAWRMRKTDAGDGAAAPPATDKGPARPASGPA